MRLGFRGERTSLTNETRSWELLFLANSLSSSQSESCSTTPLSGPTNEQPCSLRAQKKLRVFIKTSPQASYVSVVQEVPVPVGLNEHFLIEQPRWNFTVYTRGNINSIAYKNSVFVYTERVSSNPCCKVACMRFDFVQNAGRQGNTGCYLLD